MSKVTTKDAQIADIMLTQMSSTRSDAAATIYFITRVCGAFSLLIPVAVREAILRETVN